MQEGNRELRPPMPVETSGTVPVVARQASIDGGPNHPNPVVPGYTKSQAHLLVQSEHNPLPTEVPPPISALSGNHGDKHVVVLIGMPEVGKPFLAKRMRQYARATRAKPANWPSSATVHAPRLRHASTLTSIPATHHRAPLAPPQVPPLLPRRRRCALRHCGAHPAR